MTKFLSFLASRQFLSFLALIVVALVIWSLGPFVAFGGLKPLAGPGMRVVVIALLLAGVLGALARMKSVRTGARGLGKLFQSKRYLYELPWYITLGSNTSGKTSVLLNSGLSFPVAEQMQRATGTLQGDAAAVDWWLTNEAVLIDTAGYYTRQGTSQIVNPTETPNGGDQPAAGPKDEAAPEGETKGDQDKDEAADGNAKAAGSKAHAATSKPASVGPDANTNLRVVDKAEWLGFLGMLRRHRPRAPINGALLTVDLAELASVDEYARIASAAALRARLEELRADLGIRFPAYLLITKADHLPGFAEYFDSLTSEGRSQTWGFTLPHDKESIEKGGLRLRCHDELTQLAKRLAKAVNPRLQDEYDAVKRRRLAALPYEFSALIGPLIDLIDRLFLDSRYDDTQLHSTLRGVYFTSALQGSTQVAVQPHTVRQRLAAKHGPSPADTPSQPTAHRSFFLQDLLTKVVFPEGHRVIPNLRWEFRFRLLRLTGHTLALLLFAWFVIGLRVSFSHNIDYLAAIGRKAQALTTRVAQLYEEPKTEAVRETLTEARDLPSYPGLALPDPHSAWRFGLYTPPDIVAESRRTYDALEDNVLLPHIVHRMESVISTCAEPGICPP